MQPAWTPSFLQTSKQSLAIIEFDLPVLFLSFSTIFLNFQHKMPIYTKQIVIISFFCFFLFESVLVTNRLNLLLKIRFLNEDRAKKSFISF